MAYANTQGTERVLMYITMDGAHLCHSCVINHNLPIVFSFPEVAKYDFSLDQQWTIIGVQDLKPEEDDNLHCEHCGERFYPVATTR